MVLVFNIPDAFVFSFCRKVKRIGFNSSKATNEIFLCENQHSKELLMVK